MSDFPPPSFLENPRYGMLARAIGFSVVGGFVFIVLPILEHMVPLWLERPNPSAEFWSYLDQNVARLLALFFGGCLLGCLSYVAKLQLPDRVTRSTRQEVGALLQSFYHEDFDVNARPKSPVVPAQDSAGIIPLLQDLGLLKETNSALEPVSDVAAGFLHSLSAHLKDGNTTFIGDWSAGTDSPEGLRLRQVLAAIEEHRVKTAPRGNPSPSRRTRSGLALIRRDIGGKPHFLMIKSDRWTPSGAWWFVGGTEEDADEGNLLKTVKREIREEMNLLDEDILEARPLKAAKDLAISKRLGVYTEFEYQMYNVQLSQASERVKSFFVPTPKINIYYSKAVREHEFGWLPWDDILKDPNLQRDVKPIIDYLQTLQPTSILQTTSS